MKIYIAASWKHKHAVEMMTAILRAEGRAVLSFVENCNEEGNPQFVFEEWVKTEKAEQSFRFDTDAAGTSDAVLYIGPSGKDAAAECGIAFAKGVPIVGLWAKGEDFGLMRKMFSYWVEDYRHAVITLNTISHAL